MNNKLAQEYVYGILRTQTEFGKLGEYKNLETFNYKNGKYTLNLDYFKPTSQFDFTRIIPKLDYDIFYAKNYEDLKKVAFKKGQNIILHIPELVRDTNQDLYNWSTVPIILESNGKAIKGWVTTLSSFDTYTCFYTNNKVYLCEKIYTKPINHIWEYNIGAPFTFFSNEQKLLFYSLFYPYVSVALPNSDSNRYKRNRKTCNFIFKKQI